MPRELLTYQLPPSSGLTQSSSSWKLGKGSGEKSREASRWVVERLDHLVDDDVRPAHERFPDQPHVGIVKDPLSLVIVRENAEYGILIHGGFAFLSNLVGFSYIPRSKAMIALDEPIVERKKRLGAEKFYRFLQ